MLTIENELRDIESNLHQLGRAFTHETIITRVEEDVIVHKTLIDIFHCLKAINNELADFHFWKVVYNARL
jgi:hypothetical protein